MDFSYSNVKGSHSIVSDFDSIGVYQGHNTLYRRITLRVHCGKQKSQYLLSIVNFTLKFGYFMLK